MTIKDKIKALNPNAHIDFFINSTTVGFNVNTKASPDWYEFSVFCDTPSEYYAALADCLDQYRKALDKVKAGV